MQPKSHACGLMEFHVSRRARDTYQFEDTLFEQRGNVIFANFHAARIFAQKMNDKRDLMRFPEQAVTAGQINALGLIDEMLHVVIMRYREQHNPQVMQHALRWLDQQLGSTQVDATLRTFADEFPPLSVYRREQDLATYLLGSTEGVPNREILLEELLMLWMANANPAFAPYLELFDDETLEKQTVYPQLINSLQQFFEGQPRFGPEAGPGLAGESLFMALRRPALMHPHSLTAQLEFLLERYGGVLGTYLYRLLSSLDLIKEEEKMVFVGPGGPSGGGSAQVYDFTGQEHEAENFTQDREWMPRLVLIAKNAFVWLDQLSKQYNRPINTLADIPDEELDRLASYGITGLWLIGLWERSTASKTIKQLMGNQDAVASAYSLFDYVIAQDLGGEAAANNLRERAWQRGMRLASDMVPNHVGIDGKWVIEHPDWFISLPYSPFPSYTFNGPDLSYDQRVGVFLEDHYYNRTDAAVVFKRLDRYTGSEQYIYHGNDGTSMPWNDTAQLNYLNADVREAVIQTILHVARQFPVIRFDAAMTLAKKHIQRLWFPEPGSGGAIASRSDHAMTKAQFDALIPQEFWRDVVDRCAVEAPDTLLLAEAFWMMEGYFVRTLGMHRVYNSAFMNMLRDEKNGEYRQIMKNTLEFEPEILKRFVNFMNNPDERTAIEQFGSGDKYFGICALMVTLPGLPMLGHGQIEGFAEKYGMEYRRAYWDEQPNDGLIGHHERIIFPLMHRRYLFADVENFRLYDVFSPEGYVHEDVYAYSNRAGDERALVVYHNKYATVRGWIKQSSAFTVKHGNGERSQRQSTLGEGLGLHHDDNFFTIFRDQVSGLEFIRNSRELSEQGLYIELGAYEHHVFLDFREVHDTPWHQFRDLANYLGGRGVPSIEEASREIFLQPIHAPFKQLVSAEMFRRLLDSRDGTSDTLPPTHFDPALLDEVEANVGRLIDGISQIQGQQTNAAGLAAQIRRELETTLQLAAPSKTKAQPRDEQAPAAMAYLRSQLDGDPAVWSTLFGWHFTHTLGDATGTADQPQLSRSLIDEWLLGKLITDALTNLQLEGFEAARRTALIKLLVTYQRWHTQLTADQPAYALLETLLKDNEAQQFLGVNRYRDVLWYNQQALNDLLFGLFAVATITTLSDQTTRAPQAQQTIADAFAVIEQIQHAAQQSEYQIEKLLTLARDDKPSAMVEATSDSEPVT